MDIHTKMSPLGVFVSVLFPAMAGPLLTPLMGFNVKGGRGGPRAKATKSRRGSNNNNNATIVAGQQELTQLVLGSPSGSFVGGQIPLIPTFEPGSRLSRVAVEYSQYNIISSVVQFVTQATTNTSGRLVTAWTFDPLESTPVSVHQILQISRAKMGRVYQNFQTRMPRKAPDKRRFPVIEGAQFNALETVDKLMYLPATIVFGTDGSAQSGLTIGSLVWHYKIQFFNPNLVIGATLTHIPTIQPPTITGPSPRFVELGEDTTIIEELD